MDTLRCSALLRGGSLDVIRWWIASGREIDLGEPGDFATDAIYQADQCDNTEVASLLERFGEDEEETMQASRLEIGWYDAAAAEMFAVVVFVSDGLLQVVDTTPTPAARFFDIARRLPLDLQMVLCHRMVGSTKGIIQSRDSEAAFKSLTQGLFWSSIFTRD